METKITGKILVLDNNIDTDQIYPGRYLAITDPKEIGSHCLSGIDESLAGKFPQGGIVVAGRNFGCGSSREHAPIAASLGLNPILIFLASGAGARACCHVNDSFFWVYTNCMGFDMKTGLKTLSISNVFMALGGLCATFICSLWL